MYGGYANGAASGYATGAPVHVKRSSGEATLAFIDSFDPTNGMYRVSLGAPDSGQFKMAREKDIAPPPAPPPAVVDVE